MRKILFILLLLQAVAAFAQPTISPEISSDPLPARNSPSVFAVPAVAMARDHRGIAIAWTMAAAPDYYDRIFVVRLDAGGHFTGPVRIMPLASLTPYGASDASIASAPGGEGFVVAWVERPRDAVAVYSLLDSDLNQSAPVILPPNGRSIVSPPIVRSGKTTWITADTAVYEVKPDGSIGSPLNGGIQVSDMTVATDFPQLVAGDTKVTDSVTCRTDPGCITGGRFSFCNESCKIHQLSYSYSLHFTALYAASAAQTFAFLSDTQPAIRSDGHDVLIAWFYGTESKGGFVASARLDPSAFTHFPQAADNLRILGTFGADFGLSRPDIASDGERYVVVWRTASSTFVHDIAGASVDRNGKIVPFSIATSPGDERDPSVIAVGPGVFLVAYERSDGAERRVAGRFVTFDNRTHAIR